MNVLSLFDGISCAQVALKRNAVQVDKYYASEIDKFVIQITQDNHPQTIQLGDVTKWGDWDIDWSSIDLVSAGFPCQSWSMAGKQLGDKDARGKLFWVALDIIAHVLKHNPDAKFMLENVKMKKDFETYITHHTEAALGYVHKVLINSALVSAQNRNRYYWTNFEVVQPADRGVLLGDVVEVGVSSRTREYHVDGSLLEGGNVTRYIHECRESLHQCGRSAAASYVAAFTERRTEEAKRIRRESMRMHGKDFSPRRAKELVNRSDGKMNCLTATFSLKEHTLVDEQLNYRRLTPLEFERLQTVPDNYTLVRDAEGNQLVSDSQRYKALGNGFTVDVIAHIFKAAGL